MKKVTVVSILILILFLSFWAARSYTKNINRKEAKNKVEIKQADANNKKTLKGKGRQKNEDRKNVLRIYFPRGQYLKAEERREKNDPETAVKLLLKGPNEKGNINYIPKNVTLINLKKDKSRVIVNFSKEILVPGDVGARAEELTIFQITNTLTEFSDINGVVIEIEGKREGEINGLPVEDFWGHFGLYGQPYKRDESLIRE